MNPKVVMLLLLQLVNLPVQNELSLSDLLRLLGISKFLGGLITMEDLSKIIKIAGVVPSLSWIPEPSIQNYLNMKPEISVYYAFLKNKM